MTLGLSFSSSDFKCMEALGMESGEIHSDQITASSQYSTNWSSERSRLNYPENGWTPGEDSYREWIQVCGIRPGTFRVEEHIGHLQRLLKKISALRNAFRWEGPWVPSMPSVEASCHNGIPLRKSRPRGHTWKSIYLLRYLHTALHRFRAQMSHFGNTERSNFFQLHIFIDILPTSTDVYFLDELY